MENPDSYFFIFDAVMRIVGRLGFALLIIALYKLWTEIATPALKNRTSLFIKTFATALFISILLAIVDYVFATMLSRGVSMVFNVGCMYVLAYYLNKQAERIKYSKISEEYQEYSQALDKYIVSLKRNLTHGT